MQRRMQAERTAVSQEAAMASAAEVAAREAAALQVADAQRTALEARYTVEIAAREATVASLQQQLATQTSGFKAYQVRHS
jgi:hypothetical protein